MEKDDFMETKGERREQKKNRAWYKEHLASNRKSLNIIIQAQNIEFHLSCSNF